jgi:uncharacterized protein YyaL (SSP411 family)
MPNRLINESSPYLLQHANNPVEWYPWGEEALSRAKREDKPLLLSIGYSACHWCHVMERESFENEAIAMQMNTDFICIKVDREERPDLDSIYMNAVQALTGRGGWPLTVFLTPEGKPFYGGTYYPPEDQASMPGFPRLLSAISNAYQNQRSEVVQAAHDLTNSIQLATVPQGSSEHLNFDLLDQAFINLQSRYDNQHGGFGSAPKFPQPMPLEFLLRYHLRTENQAALHMVEHTLKSMAHGGIHDHLAGGFHRYSTDAQWIVPHFEKMLYDNALLASLYAQCYQVTADPLYKSVAEATLNYLIREMRHDSGGFYSSQDADSDSEEGRYYTWSPAELSDCLGPEDAELISLYYGVTDEGNFDGKTILQTSIAPDEIAHARGIPTADLQIYIQHLKSELLRARSKRIAPATDDKIITSWNAMALRSFALGGLIFGQQRYIRIAESLGKFLIENLYNNGRLYRVWKGHRSNLFGYLEDYAYTALSLLTLHEATFSHYWLTTAKLLTDEMLSLFWDPERKLLFDVGIDHEQLAVRPREVFDNAIPSGNSTAAELLLRMSKITGDPSYQTIATQLLESASNYFPVYSMGFGQWLSTVELYLAQPMEIAIIGNREDPEVSDMLQMINTVYLPHKVLVGANETDIPRFSTPILEGKTENLIPVSVYICENYACNLPAHTVQDLKDQLHAIVNKRF